MDSIPVSLFIFLSVYFFLAWWVLTEAYRILVVDAGFSPGVVCRLQSVWALQGWCAGSSVCGLSRGGVQAQQLWNMGLVAPWLVGS